MITVCFRLALGGPGRGPDRHRVNALITGGVDTPLSRSLARGDPAPTPEEAWRSAERMRPPARLARPDEIAAFAAFLLSDETGFITGAALAIDGGMTARL
ncbi:MULTISPECIES: SDR family oxidoreductase [unclassified Streptomyces]|uniref:SDR family oxidoreductase n=1 Tax=unclassified Streptomyces TaxID=2593676 RepID=UPI000382E2DE|nr:MULTISPECIES: SDR family oxidoreductase [unclassified Streptomyces]MYX33037.1 SDR family oxidoreductase [Streptomyces sp. SID8377]